MPMAAVMRMAWRPDSAAAAKIHGHAFGGAGSDLSPKNGSIATENIPRATNWKARKLNTPKPSAHDWIITSVSENAAAQPSANTVVNPARRLGLKSVRPIRNTPAVANAAANHCLAVSGQPK